jgi:hypothetical protein
MGGAARARGGASWLPWSIWLWRHPARHADDETLDRSRSLKRGLRERLGCGVVLYTGLYAKPIFPDTKLDKRSLDMLKRAASLLIFAGKGCETR